MMVTSSYELPEDEYLRLLGTSGYELPEDEYLRLLGKAQYLFALLEGLVSTAVGQLYVNRLLNSSESHCSSCGKEDPLVAEARQLTYSSGASGEKLKQGLNILKKRLSNRGFTEEASYVKAVTSKLFDKIDGRDSLVDRRNLLAHSWFGEHPSQGPRLNRRYFQDQGAHLSGFDRWQRPGVDGSGIFVDDRWIEVYIEDLEQARDELFALNKGMTLPTQEYDRTTHSMKTSKLRVSLHQTLAHKPWLPHEKDSEPPTLNLSWYSETTLYAGRQAPDSEPI